MRMGIMNYYSGRDVGGKPKSARAHPNLQHDNNAKLAKTENNRNTRLQGGSFQYDAPIPIDTLSSIPAPAPPAKLTSSSSGSSIATSSSYYSCNSQQLKTPLPSNFKPGTYDVICQKGKQAKRHPGNRRYRHLIDMCVKKYAMAETRIEKSTIVSEIVDAIYLSSPDGGFVRYQDGQWWEVGTPQAREKTGQLLRASCSTLNDCGGGTSPQYRSTTRNKRLRRINESTMDLDELQYCSEEVKQSIKNLEDVALNINSSEGSYSVEDEEILFAFTIANSQLLTALKNDQKIFEYHIIHQERWK